MENIKFKYLKCTVYKLEKSWKKDLYLLYPKRYFVWKIGNDVNSAFLGSIVGAVRSSFLSSCSMIAYYNMQFALALLKIQPGTSKLTGVVCDCILKHKHKTNSRARRIFLLFEFLSAFYTATHECPQKSFSPTGPAV